MQQQRRHVHTHCSFLRTSKIEPQSMGLYAEMYSLMSFIPLNAWNSPLDEFFEEKYQAQAVNI